MNGYRWVVVAAEMLAPPVQAGISGDPGKAKEEAGAALLASLGTERRGIVALVETVRLALVAPGIDEGYVPAGDAWVGRRDRRGGVHWAERDAS